MSFLLDTDICSAFLKQNASLYNRFNQYSGQLSISVVSVGELFTWVYRRNAPPTRLQGLLALLNDLRVLEVDVPIARRFGEIRAQLLDRGHVVPTADMLIAATAIEHGLTLVTHNTQHYVNVPQLPMIDWLLP